MFHIFDRHCYFHVLLWEPGRLARIFQEYADTSDAFPGVLKLARRIL